MIAVRELRFAAEAKSSSVDFFWPRRSGSMMQGSELIRKLVGTAKKGLQKCYDRDTALFENRITEAGIRPERQGLLLTHSLISLLGISGYRDVEVDYDRSVDTIFKMTCRTASLRELSLLLWLLAKEKDGRAQEVFRRIDKIPDDVVQRAETMEIAWLLTALVFEIKRKEDRPAQQKLANIFRILEARFIPETGLFLHRAKNKLRDLRYGISNFADQIYSIYALSQCYGLSKQDRSLDMADQCALKIAALQGPQGQWWWHYNALTGDIHQKYPVFSVHQDAMAPFALMSLNAVSHHDYSRFISAGLRWMDSNNELNAPMIHSGLDFIKRGIERKSFFAKAHKLATLAFCVTSLKLALPRYDHPEYLKVMNWEYSYHPGWVLYAFKNETEDLWSKF